jgi:N-formylglutamate amidohydrolase
MVSIPHSGEQVPPEAEWLCGLPETILMCDVDRFVDRLYRPALDELEIPCVATPWHRYVVDLNRLPEDIGPDSVRDAIKVQDISHLASGLHWVKTTRGALLLEEPISLELHNLLVKKYYQPFHAEMEAQFQSLKKMGHPEVYHLDLHSMPSVGTSAHPDPGNHRAPIVISDLHGKSSKAWFKDLVIESFKTTGLNVEYNYPYKGGRVTERYGHPDQGQHTLQIEINRSLYMNETSKQWLSPDAEALQDKLKQAMTAIHQALP